MAIDFAVGNLTVLDNKIIGTASFPFTAFGDASYGPSGGGGSTATNVTDPVTGITWYFDTARPVGQFVTGEWWVQKPVTITTTNPAFGPRSVTVGGVPEDIDGNGSELDPAVCGSSVVGPNLYGDGQGFDAISTHSRRSSYQQPPWDPTRRQAFPATFSASGTQSLVTVRSEAGVLSTGGATPYLLDAAVLTLVDTPIPQNAFRPPYVGGGAKPVWTTNDVDYTKLPSLPDPANMPTPLGDKYKQPMLWHASKAQAGHSLTPQNNVDTTYPGNSLTHGDIALAVCLASQDQVDLANRLIQQGIDLYEIHLQNEAGFIALGGFDMAKKFPILFAGALLNSAAMKSLQLYVPHKTAVHKFQEDGFTFFGDPIATVHPEHPSPDWQTRAPWFGIDCYPVENQAAEPYGNALCRAQSPAYDFDPHHVGDLIKPGTIDATDADRYPDVQKLWCNFDIVYHSGTIRSASNATQIQLAADASSDPKAYLSKYVRIVTGTGAGQWAWVDSYDAANKICYLAPDPHGAHGSFSPAPTAGGTYVVNFAVRGGMYRIVNETPFMAQGLAARIINSGEIMTAWGWDPFFEYVDRTYLEEAEGYGTGGNTMYGSPFVRDMWRAHRGFLP